MLTTAADRAREQVEWVSIFIYKYHPINGTNETNTSLRMCALHISMHIHILARYMYTHSYGCLFVCVCLRIFAALSLPLSPFVSIFCGLCACVYLCLQIQFDWCVSQQKLRCQHTCKHLRLFYVHIREIFCSLSLAQSISAYIHTARENIQ